MHLKCKQFFYYWRQKWNYINSAEARPSTQQQARFAGEKGRHGRSRTILKDDVVTRRYGFEVSPASVRQTKDGYVPCEAHRYWSRGGIHSSSMHCTPNASYYFTTICLVTMPAWLGRRMVRRIHHPGPLKLKLIEPHCIALNRSTSDSLLLPASSAQRRGAAPPHAFEWAHAAPKLSRKQQGTRRGTLLRLLFFKRRRTRIINTSHLFQMRCYDFLLSTSSALHLVVSSFSPTEWEHFLPPKCSA